jgi:hypothetical protein
VAVEGLLHKAWDQEAVDAVDDVVRAHHRIGARDGARNAGQL